MKILRKLLLVATLVFIIPIINGQHYVGIPVGQAYFSDFSVNADSSLMSGSQTLSMNDNSPSIKISTGYEFNQFLAIEGSIGEYDALDGAVGSLGDLRFFSFQGKATWSITQTFNTFIKSGFSYNHAKLESIYGGGADESVIGKYGLGIEFRVSDDLSTMLEWDYMKYNMDILKLGDASATMSTKINVFSVGAAYRF